MPEGRIYHTLFTTAEPRPRVAVCGGYLEGWLETASCLVLDKQTGTWDGSRLGSLPQPRYFHTVVTLKNIGNYLIGGFDGSHHVITTYYLAPGSQTWVSGPKLPWVSGPNIPVEMREGPCSVVISETSFLAINGYNILEYQVDLENPTIDAGWLVNWPQLQRYRTYCGCAKILGRDLELAMM